MKMLAYLCGYTCAYLTVEGDKPSTKILFCIYAACFLMLAIIRIIW